MVRRILVDRKRYIFAWLNFNLVNFHDIALWQVVELTFTNGLSKKNQNEENNQKEEKSRKTRQEARYEACKKAGRKTGEEKSYETG